MKNNLLAKLEALHELAKQQIESIVMQKSFIAVYAGDNKEELELEEVCELPDFPFYGRHGYLGHAAIKSVSFREDVVIITGILKTDEFPKEVLITLPEMDSYSTIALADFLENM